MNTIYRNFIFVAFVAGIFAACLPQSASADSHKIKYRQSVMSAIGGTMGALAAVLKKQAPAEHVVSLALTMRNLASIVPDIYPKGSDFGETDALPAIWEKPKEFKARLNAFILAAALLPDAAAAGGEIYKSAFIDLGKACKGCHENFRKKKDK